MPFLPIESYKRRTKTTHIVVHCAATKPSQDVGVKEIREWHVKQRGFQDIGYHYVIRRNGVRECGRPTWAVGAHVEGFNSTTVGVCLVGGVNEAGEPENNFTPEQMTMLGETVQGLVDYYPAVEVCGHHDFPDVKKACPSFDAKKWWTDANAD